MKAALGEANQDHVLCEGLGKASPGHQPKSLIVQRKDGPWAALAGTHPVSVTELWFGTKLLLKITMQDRAISQRSKKAILITFICTRWRNGFKEQLCWPCFCNPPTDGISDKRTDPVLVLWEEISISVFSPRSKGDPNQALNGKSWLYFWHFKPTGQVVSSLVEATSQLLFESVCFLGSKPRLGRERFLQCCNPRLEVNSTFYNKKPPNERQIHQQVPVLKAPRSLHQTHKTELSGSVGGILK